MRTLKHSGNTLIHSRVQIFILRMYRFTQQRVYTLYNTQVTTIFSYYFDRTTNKYKYLTFNTSLKFERSRKLDVNNKCATGCMTTGSRYKSTGECPVNMQYTVLVRQIQCYNERQNGSTGTRLNLAPISPH